MENTNTTTNKFEYKYKDPSEWTIEDTKGWLNGFKQKSPLLSNEDFTKFEWSGDQLMLYSLEDFQKMSSPYGLALYRNLHSLTKSDWNKSLKNGRNLENYNISKDLIETEIIDRTVIIRIGTKNTFISLGCGLRIGGSFILTSKHVIHHVNFQQDKIIYNIGVNKPLKWATAKLIEMTSDTDDLDLALLEIYDDNDSLFNLDDIMNSNTTNKQTSPNKNRLSSSSSGNNYQDTASSSTSTTLNNSKQQHDNKYYNENGELHEKNHIVNSSEYTKPNFDYHHLDENEKEKQKEDFQKIISIPSITFNNISEGCLLDQIILCGYPKERIAKQLITDFKINILPPSPSIEKGYVSYSDERLIELSSTPEPGYSESSIVFRESDAKFLALVKTQYISNPHKYYCTPGIQVQSWLNQTLKKHNINSLSF